MGISVSTKMIIFEAKLWSTVTGMLDFTGSPSWWLSIYEKTQGMHVYIKH